MPEPQNNPGHLTSDDDHEAHHLVAGCVVCTTYPHHGICESCLDKLVLIGVEGERGRIVAWLRTEPEEDCGCRPLESCRYRNPMTILECAEEIERGDHA